MSGEYSVYTLFDDWIAMLSIAFAQAVDHKEGREEQYHQIAGKYSEERLKEFCRLNALLVEAAEEKMEDILDIFICTSKWEAIGQGSSSRHITSAE